MPKPKNTTNYSQAQIERNLKRQLDEKRKKVEFNLKSKAATKKLNSTQGGKIKIKSKKVSPIARLNEIGKQTRSSAQLRAIYAKKK